MATRIRATCPTCGEVEVLAEQVTLRVAGYTPDDVGEGSVYRFDCPGCYAQVDKPADARIAGLLVSGGCPVQCVADDRARQALVDGLQAASHPEGWVLGPPITADDICEFHRVLERPDWFDLLTGEAA